MQFHVNIPFSAAGSRAALGSSNSRNPTLVSSESTARMNIRDLVEKGFSRPIISHGLRDNEKR